MREIISFTIKRELRENIDDIRGDVPRSKYINRVLEQSVTELKNKNFEKENKLPVDNSLPTVYQQTGIVRGEN